MNLKMEIQTKKIKDHHPKKITPYDNKNYSRNKEKKK